MTPYAEGDGWTVYQADAGAVAGLIGPADHLSHRPAVHDPRLDDSIAVIAGCFGFWLLLDFLEGPLR